jgi:hypothetical protein
MADENDDEWRFSVDEVGPDDEGEEGPPEEAWPGEANERTASEADESVTLVGEDDDAPTVGVATGEGDEDGNVAGALTPEMPVEPGTPSPENVVFATAGAVLTALVFAAVATDLDAATAAWVVAGVAVPAVVLYALFRRY